MTQAQNLDSFARRFARVSVRAARRANRLAVMLQNEGSSDDAALWRELARVNMREAKARKQSARMRGEW